MSRWTLRARPDQPRLGRVLVVDENNATVAVVEHMRADAAANANIIAAAPELDALLRRLVGVDRGQYESNTKFAMTIERIQDAARPLLAAIDGAPALATESIEMSVGFCSEHDGLHEQFRECENWRAGRMSVFVTPAPAESEA